jgi:hypothetical protein
VTTLAQQAPPLPEAPYRGIEPFRYIDQKIFSARDEETWDLLSNILIYRGVLLYGDSGSGKSSLINAGLIPAAANENLVAHRLRIQPRRGREIKLERIPTESEDHPPYLPSIFVEEGSSKGKDMSLEISLEDFYESLDRLRKTPSDTPRPLLIFDQFEEFIALFEEALHGGETPEAKRVQEEAPEVQKAILATLTSLMEDDELRVKILFVFREEYLAKLNVLFKACPELLDQYVRLLPPRVEVAEEIIRTPFVDEELKAKFIGGESGGSGSEITQPLAEAIAAQLQQRSESGFLNLTELQIICRRIWDSRNPVKFFRENDDDIQKVLEDYWTDVLKKLGDLYQPAIALLGHMVTSSNTRNIVSEPDLKYHEKDNFTPEQIDAALSALVKRKLVRREPRHTIYFYEIASEFLVPWIQQQKSARLAQIEASRLAAETEKKLKQAVKARRNLLIGGIILGSLLIVAVFLAIKSYRLQEIAVAAQAELKTEKERSENLVKLLDSLSNKDEKVRLAAVKELVALDQSGKLQRELARVIVAVTSSETNEEVSKAASYFYTSLKAQEDINPAGSEFTESILRTAEEKNEVLTTTKLPPRVYIQIAGDQQRGRADKIANALRSSGFTVPAYEVVGDRAPKNNQLRYYKSLDDTQSSASTGDLDRALQKIKEADGPSWTSVQLRRSSSVRPGHFEIWFAGEVGSTPSPTASPTPARSVELKLTLKDEQDKELFVIPRVSLEDVPFSGRSIIRTSSSVTAPAGDYLLFVQVPGYPVYRQRITLQGTIVYHTVQLQQKRSAR